MKKRKTGLIIFWLSITISQAQIQDAIRINEYDVKTNRGQVYDRIAWNSAYTTTEEGKPELPYYRVSYVLPVDVVVEGVTFQNTTKQQLKEKLYIHPVQAPVPVGNVQEDESIQSNENKEVYASDTPYPGKLYEIESDDFFHGYHIVTLRIYPFEYLPKSRILNYYPNLEYSIEYSTGENPDVIKPLAQSLWRAELGKNFVKRLVKNIEDVELFGSNVQKLTGGKNAIQKNTNRLRSQSLLSISNEITPDYIIITCDSLKSAFQPLADWKTKKGVFTIIVTTEEIDADYSGCDLQEKIREYLIHAYSQWGTVYVLLGGDINIIPSRFLKRSTTLPSYPADIYYCAYYSSEWNPQSTTMPIDFWLSLENRYKVILGRVPVSNVQEVNTYINKVIAYEKTQGITDLSYYNNLLIADAFILRCSKLDYRSVVAHGNLKSYTTTYLPNHANPWLMFDNYNCTGTLYSYSGGSPYCCTDGVDSVSCLGGTCVTGNIELTRDNFLNTLNTGGNSGLNHFHIVYHMDHSGAYGMGTSGKDKGQSINRADMDSLKNGPSLQILMSGGCSTSNFQYDCVAKHYLINPTGGGVAFIGNTDVGFASEYPQFQYFLDAIYSTSGHPSIGRYDIGSAFQNVHIKENQVTNWRLHLLGDPEMQVWTDTPDTLHVSLSDSILVTGENTITVTIANPPPPGEEVTICFQKGDEVYMVDPYMPNSQTYTVTPHTKGTLNVTITAHNYVPYEASLPVVAGQYSLFVSGINIIDDGTNGSIGNGNGKVDAGETIALDISLTNSGSVIATGVEALLSIPTYEFATNSGIVSFGTILPGQTKGSSTLFGFHVDNSAEEWLNPVRFFLNITDGNGRTYFDDFTVDLFASQIEQGNKTIVSTSNGNTVIEAGETVQIKIDLSNTGGADATGLTGILSSNNSPYIVSCSSTPVSFPTIGKNETKTSTGTFQFTVSNAYTNSSWPLDFTLLVENEYGKIWPFDFNLADRPDSIRVNTISSVGALTEIELFWTGISGLKYNIYRSDVDTITGNPIGNYMKLNNFPVSFTYFKDYGLAPLTKYAYRISVVSASGNEGELCAPHITWTSYPAKGFFPIQMSIPQVTRIIASINAADVNNDGYPEIFTCTDHDDVDRIGYIIGLDHEGVELFHINNNITNYDGFAEFNASMQAPVAIGDLYATGEAQIVSVTRDLNTVRANYVTCHAAKDTNGDHLPDTLWQNTTANSHLKGAVIANVDNSGDGSMEIILKACGNSGTQPDGKKIQILDNMGNLLYSIVGPSSNYSALAVADLDGDGDKEIIAGYSDGVYIWHHDGTFYSNNAKIFSDPDYYFYSSPVICDWDGCGQKEILIVGSKIKSSGNPSEGVVFVLKQDSTEISGWGKMQGWPTATFPISAENLSQEISVGDLYGDGHLSVVSLGQNSLKIWDQFGNLISVPLSGVNGQLNTPMLADVDGDDEIEIIAVTRNGDKVYGIKPDGTSALGFPLHAEEVFDRSSPCVIDLDNNGKSEVIAAAGNKVFVWETNGDPARIEWGSERNNPENTGEYRKACPKTIIRENTTWSSNREVCDNIIIESGTLTLSSTCTLTMGESSMIIVRPGANLVIDGATILGANLKALPQSSVTLKNNAYVKLRKNGEFKILLGAALKNQYGKIDITP